MKPIKVFLMALTTFLLIAGASAFAQDLGHEYEGEVAPIREGEKPVIPLDTEDPSYNVWRSCAI